MVDLVLTYSTSDGSEKILIDREKTSFGRGGEADYRFEDDGLSRLHATLYSEDGRVWIVDEGSTNGTFVNGEKVGSAGTPVSEGDTIKIGHFTTLEVAFEETSGQSESEETAESGNPQSVVAVSSTEAEKTSIIAPLLITGIALLVVCGAAVFIGVMVMKGNQPRVVQNQDPFNDFEDDDLPENDNEEPVATATNTPSTISNEPPPSTPTTPNTNDSTVTNSPQANNRTDPVLLPSGKKYQAMSASEQDRYVKLKAEKVARIIGNRSGQSIPPKAVSKIKHFLRGYVSKIRAKKKNDCSMGGWRTNDMVSILERGRANAPFIIRAFNEKGIDPQVGLYLAMIESEHCPCLQSPTGPLGMFQFTRATARRFGLDARSGASPSNPDERCEPKAAANAAARYMKSLSGRIGTGPLSIPLAIASYNSGEGGLGKNLKIALEANESQERSFWTLITNAELLAKQFKEENIKYVPKFFAAAIIGENPRDFGVNLQPLSAYVK